MKDDSLLPFQRLDAYRVAKQLAQVVHAAKIADRELREQATSAAKSTFLRLCEGLPLEGAAMRRKYFAEAEGSLCETLGCVDLAATIASMRAGDADKVQELGVRLKRLLRGLMHSR
jgi:four helix bundle protein